MGKIVAKLYLTFQLTKSMSSAAIQISMAKDKKTNQIVTANEIILKLLDFVGLMTTIILIIGLDSNICISKYVFILRDKLKQLILQFSLLSCQLCVKVLVGQTFFLLRHFEISSLRNMKTSFE